MVSIGDAFECRVDPCHIYVVITHPDENGYAVIVNFSSSKGGAEAKEDTSCVLMKADYPSYIKKKTIVMYKYARHGPVGHLATNDGFARKEAVSSATLAKIRDGALKSTKMNPAYQRIISEEGCL